MKAPVAAVFGDLPAKAEISPFKGYQADVFCPHDMYSKRSDTGQEFRRDLRTLRRQIQKIQGERTVIAKKRLRVKFGLDINNLETVFDRLDKFDVTQDLPADLLHQFTLDWGKRSFIHLKNEILSEESLDKLCLVFD